LHKQKYLSKSIKFWYTSWKYQGERSRISAGLYKNAIHSLCT